MTREGAIQLICLYGPLVSAALLLWWMRPAKRQATGLLFSLAWNAALLPWLDGGARLLGLWDYHSQSASIGGMPLALYFGWIIGWGVVAPLLAKALGGRLWTAAALLVMIDLRAMPEMSPVLELHPLWWAGEFALAALLLVPSMFMARWTASRERIGLRCAMLVPTFGGIFLGIPLLAECGEFAGIFSRWQGWPEPARRGMLLACLALSVPGLTAVRDLARSGGGTPVPLDPPRHLVTHGIYAFIRNPMQLSMTLLLLLESWLLVLLLLRLLIAGLLVLLGLAALNGLLVRLALRWLLVLLLLRLRLATLDWLLVLRLLLLLRLRSSHWHGLASLCLLLRLNNCWLLGLRLRCRLLVLLRSRHWLLLTSCRISLRTWHWHRLGLLSL